jgi:hypothetical protein
MSGEDRMPGKSELRVGVAAIAAAAFLLLVAIPYGVTKPGNVRNIVLSPTFWPQILAGLLALGGIGLLISARRAEPREEDIPILEIGGGLPRLAGMAILMLGYFLLIPVLGMVWASMLAFGTVAMLVQTRHPITAAISAVLVPLVLYAFFAHVAGVSVPQGDLVRLP